MRKQSAWEKANEGASPSQLIDARIEELGDWRGETLAHVRELIHQADPEVVEDRAEGADPGRGGPERGLAQRVAENRPRLLATRGTRDAARPTREARRQKRS